MSPSDERNLYESDHAAWCAYAAPRWRERLRDATDADKRAAWATASQGLRAAIRALSAP